MHTLFLGEKMVCFIITGLPATGKTYYSDYILSYLLRNNGKVCHIYGDAIAHISYGCVYSEEQMNLKYDNMEALIKNAIAYKYNAVVIDDLFKRREDFVRIYALFNQVCVVYLKAELEDIIKRNDMRPKYHRLSQEKLLSYVESYSDVISLQDIDFLIDVSNCTKISCKKQLRLFVQSVLKENENEVV